ncbi:unnamed protein product, partial [Mycena citricolor]
AAMKIFENFPMSGESRNLSDTLKTSIAWYNAANP